MQPNGLKKTIMDIPGGDKFFSTVSGEDLPGIAYNWLRARPQFENLIISFKGDFEDPNELAEEGGVVIKTIPVPNSKNIRYWWRNKLKGTANDIAKIMSSESHYLAISVDQNGITLYKDNTKKFTPDSEKFRMSLLIKTQSNR